MSNLTGHNIHHGGCGNTAVAFFAVRLYVPGATLLNTPLVFRDASVDAEAEA